MDLSIIIVNYNSGDQLAKALKSVQEFTRNLSYEIIVVDNNSKDRSLALIEDLSIDNLLICKNKDNLGFAKANNIGLRQARGNVCVLLNPDVWIENNVFMELHKVIMNNEGIGVLGCKIIYPDGTAQTSAYAFTSLTKLLLQLFLNPLRNIAKKPILAIASNKLLPKGRVFRNNFLNYYNGSGVLDVDCVTGACMVFRKQILDKMGYLDESFFMYYEDEDFCRRVKEIGLKVGFCPHVSIKHVLGWGKNKRNKFLYWTKYKSLKHYCAKYYKDRFCYYWILRGYIYLLFKLDE